MLDETLSPALAATLGPGELAPTLEIKVNFISPAKVGRVIGTGRVISRGRSICSMGGKPARREWGSFGDRYGDLEDWARKKGRRTASLSSFPGSVSSRAPEVAVRSRLG